MNVTFFLIPKEAMVDVLAKGCGTEKIIVLFSENTDLLSNIYTCKTESETSMIYNKEGSISLKQNKFFMEHKLSPVQLTWLHLVYGKILYFPRHPLLMVYVEC